MGGGGQLRRASLAVPGIIGEGLGGPIGGKSNGTEAGPKTWVAHPLGLAEKGYVEVS